MQILLKPEYFEREQTENNDRRRLRHDPEAAALSVGLTVSQRRAEVAAEVDYDKVLELWAA